MKKSFEDRKRKPIKPSKVITMAEYLISRIERVILAKKEIRIFEGMQNT
jgi:hypothetical protein